MRSSDSGPLSTTPGAWLAPAVESSTTANLGRKLLVATATAAVGAGVGIGLVYFSTAVALAAVLTAGFLCITLMRPFVGLLFYTIIFLLRPGELYPALAPLHLERVVGTIGIFSIFLAQHRKEGSLLLDDSRQTRLLLLFLIAASLSVPLAYYRRGALSGLFEMVKIVCFYIMIVHCVDTRTRLRWFLLVFSAFVLFIAATSLHSYRTGEFMFAQGIERAVGVTSAGGDPNALASTMSTTLPIFLVLMLHRPFRWWQVFPALGAVLLLVTQAVTGSRAYLLGLVTGLAWLWWSSRHRAALLFAGLAVLAAGYFLLPGQYKVRYGTIASSQLDASSQGRVKAWKAGLEMVIDRPLFGVGIRCFGVAHAMDYSPGPRRTWLEAHSLYIQVLAEVGLVGTLVFFAFLYEILRLNRAAAHRLRAAGPEWRFESRILDAIFAGFLILLVSSVFGHSLLRRTWYVYAALGIAVLRMHLEATRSESKTESATPTGHPSP